MLRDLPQDLVDDGPIAGKGFRGVVVTTDDNLRGFGDGPNAGAPRHARINWHPHTKDLLVKRVVV